MRGTAVCIGLIAAAGCKGGDTDIDVDPVPFLGSARPAGITADLPPEGVDAHDATVALWGIVGLLATDVNVRDLLEIHGGQSRGDIPPCWTSSLQAITASVSYDACSAEGLVGGATVQDTPTGPLVMRVDDAFDLGQARFTGNLGLTPDPDTAFVWTVSSVSPTGQPSTDPITVHLGGREVSMVPGGWFSMDFLNDRIAVWGPSQVSASDGDATVLAGGVDPGTAEVAPDAARTPAWPVCSCPTQGALAYPTELTVTSVDVDISRALDGQGTIWPVVPVDTALALPGTLTLTPVSCGEWSGTFEPDAGAVLTLPGADLRTGITRACTSNAFDTPEQCEAVRLGADAVQGLDLELDAAILDAMADSLADRQLANGFCTP